MWLCYTEEEFWKLTPRQLKAQIDVHEDVLKQMHGTGSAGNTREASRNPMGFIDNIPGW